MKWVKYGEIRLSITNNEAAGRKWESVNRVYLREQSLLLMSN